MQTPQEHLPSVSRPLVNPGGLKIDEILDRLGGDWGLFEEVCDVFLQETPAMLTAIREAIRERNPSKLHRSAHSLKGAVSVLSADDCVETALALEQMGRENKAELASGECDVLEQKLCQLTASIEAQRGSSKLPPAEGQ